MNIVFIAARYYYGNPAAGDGYEALHIGGALSDMGHRVIAIDLFGDNPNAGMERAAESADVVILNPHRDEIDRDRFAALPARKLVLLSDDEWRRPYGLAWAASADHMLTNALDGAAAYGDKYVSWQWGVRKALVTTPTRHLFDVTFIGQAYTNRPAAIAALRANGFKPYVRGKGWPEGEATTAMIPRLLASAHTGLTCNLNSRGSGYQVKARNFEVAAAGCCPLLERAPGIERYYEQGQEAVYWSSLDEMVQGARALRGSDMGARARERTLDEHTYTHRWRSVFEQIGM